MPITFLKGDLLASGADILVCPVNCGGTMARGLAKRFAGRFNGLKHAFRNACQQRLVLPTVTWQYRVPDGPIVACAVTKRHWSQPSSVRDIDTALRSLVSFLRLPEPARVAIPALGCGLGGLPWKQIKPLMERHLGFSKHEILVFAPILVFEPPKTAGENHAKETETTEDVFNRL